MSCETASRNATPPQPAIAPPTSGSPAAQDIDPRAVAEALALAHGPGGIDPRVPALAPGFDAPFFQAGLAGYSDAAMRLIARRHGAPFCVTEALLDVTLLAGGRGFAKADLGDIEDNIPGGADDHPIAGQIMGSEPAEMAIAALKMIEQGARATKEYRELAATKRRSDEATEGKDSNAIQDPPPSSLRRSVAPSLTSFTTIDVNLACPVKKVRAKARGGHWLAEPDGAIAILQAVRDALPADIPVTVKMRRSYDDTPEMRDNFFRIFDAAYDIGCAWVTVHARTVEQKYVGPSRWDLLRDIVQRDHPGRHQRRLVFGSGDVWTAHDVFRMIAYTGVTGASIARGCIGNPWIFRQCRDLLAGRAPSPPTLAEQRAVLEDHFRLALAVNHRAREPEALTARTMRKFAIQFAKHHPAADPVQRAFTTVKTLDDWHAILNTHYPHPR